MPRGEQIVRKRSITGILVVFSMFALGGAMLWGLFHAPHLRTRAAPGNVVWEVPDRPIRFVSYNILHSQRGQEQIVEEIRKLEPDVVCLQEIESRDVVPLAEALGFQQYYETAAYQRSENLAGPKATWGNVILSRFPLYDVAAIPNPGGGIFGVWATVVVDDRKFVIANVHLSATWNANPIHIKQSGEYRNKELSNLLTAWRQRGSPPIVIAGDFNQIPMGNNYYLMTQEHADALEALGKTGATFDGGLLQTRIDYFLLSREWRAMDGGVVRTKASDHRPIWLKAVSSSATTQRASSSSPATRESRGSR